ncbi:hypothetical protein DV738_g2602, partial [Chaetothyriales sp. CBS 135597]
MAKIKKKGESGQARNYITRTQAVRKLQISLPDFRRLCIFKGIYPREPRNFKKAHKSATHSTTFYYTKDIQYLLHEPLLAKFRDQKALSKKIARSLGRYEVQDAVRLEKQHTPKITLDHIVRERYPTFIDALRDLDDALSLLFLFANLPSTATVPPKTIARCQRLCHEFEHYLIATHSLRRSFLSIKGIYYQATIQGQDIMWLVPYRFVQQVTQDVDYRIMGTFVEFYCTLLGFVNYRLYTQIGLVYPPKFDVTSDERGAELAAFTLQGRNTTEAIEESEEPKSIANGHADSNTADVQALVDQAAAAQGAEAETEVQTEQTVVDEGEEEAEVIDKFEVAAPEGDALPQPEISSNEAGNLFANMTVFISREAPRHPLEFLLRAFGCKRLGWDRVLGEGAFTHDETDQRITHQIVDRPAPVDPLPVADGSHDSQAQNTQTVKPGHFVPGRIYVQPQWVWDCVNEGQLVRTDLYAPGATLPPHLSPWVKPTSGQYDPRVPLADQEEEGEADEAIEEGDEDEEDEEEQEADEALEDIENDPASDSEEAENLAPNGMVVADLDAESSEDEGGEDQGEQDGFGGFNDQELAAEVLGQPLSAVRADPEKIRKEKAKKDREARRKKEDEELERRKMMMSNKKRKLYEKMQHSNEKKDAEAAKLRQKRRKLERRAEQWHLHIVCVVVHMPACLNIRTVARPAALRLGPLGPAVARRQLIAALPRSHAQQQRRTYAERSDAILSSDPSFKPTDPAKLAGVAPEKARFRPLRLLLYLVLIGALSYGGAVWYALRSDNFHDFFTEYVPFGEDVVLYFDERSFRRRFNDSNRNLHRTGPRTIADDKKITIPLKSGLSWKVAEQPPAGGADATQKDKASSSPDATKTKDKPAQSTRAKTTDAETAAPKPVVPTAEKQKDEPKTPAPSPKEDARPAAVAKVAAIAAVPVANADEPVLQELAKAVNDLITVINADAAADGPNKYAGSISKAKESLTTASDKLQALREAEQAKAEERVQQAHKEFDSLARQLIDRVQTAQKEEEARYREEFEAERAKLAEIHDAKLRAELERSNAVAEQRLVNELTNQAIEMKRQFVDQIQTLVEAERDGRLSKLTDLSTNVDNLTQLTSNWNGVIDSNLATQKLQVAVDSVRAALERSNQADARPTPFVREMAALKLTADGDPVVDAAIASINPSAYQKGIPSQAQLIDRFRRVATEVRKASLLPENAGIASHAASLVLSKVLFKKQGQPQGTDVESVLTRTESLLEEGDLDAAAREINGLTGWAAVLSRDWLTDVRKVLEVNQALDVVETEARLQCLRVE